jgi:EmrB/QacA subfamily drug resistance transporter
MTSSSQNRRRLSVLVLVGTTFFMLLLDFSVVNIALPYIQLDLKFSQLNLQWIASAYALTLGGFLLLGGRVADLLGRRRVLLTGLIIFMVASFIGGLANSQSILITCRAAQGFGGALIAPTALSIVNTTFSEGVERNRAMGIFGAMASGGFTTGMLLGGLLTAGLGWRWIFFINIPIGAGVVAFTPSILQESRVKATARHSDLLGAVSVTTGLVLLVYALVGAERVGWSSLQTISLLGLALVMLAAFILIESCSQDPLVPLRIFRLRTLTIANLLILLVEAVSAAAIYLLSLCMQQVLNYSALQTGLAFLPLGILLATSSKISSSFITGYGIKPVVVSGTALTSLSFLFFNRVTVDSSYVKDLLPAMIIFALGSGFSITAGIIAATLDVLDKEQGLAAGLVETSRQIGAAFGLAILPTVATARTSHLAHSAVVSSKEALAAGFQHAFIVEAGISALGMFIAIFALHQKKWQHSKNRQS